MDDIISKGVKKMNRINEKGTGSTLDRLMDCRDLIETRKNKDRMLLAVRVAEAIKSRGHSNSAFADLIGRKLSLVNEWLSGSTNLDVDTLSEISFMLGITLSSLLNGTSETG